MALYDASKLGPGGTGFQGTGPGSAAAVLGELQGLSIELLAGAAQDTKVDLAAIRAEDTLLKVLNNNGGTITDVTATTAITDIRASGTLTFVSAVADATFEVAGVTYTLVTTATGKNTDVVVGGDDTEQAENAVAAINAYEASVDRTGPALVSATNALGVVTVTAILEGAGGNAYTLVGDTGITASAATLENGSDTGGVESTSGTTNQLIVFWYDKR